MRICSAYPIDFATANTAFLEGQDSAGRGQASAGQCDDQVRPFGSRSSESLDVSPDKGWAVFASAQDGANFGNWVNPVELKWLNYCQGETTLVEFKSPSEFAVYCRDTYAWYERNDGVTPRIEPGPGDSLKQVFVRVGLGDLLS